MKRYQLYLNPHSISIIDEIEQYTDISRSAIIRMVIDSVAENIAKVLTKKTNVTKNYPYLDSLVGSIRIKGKKQTNYVLREDDLYLQD